MNRNLAKEVRAAGFNCKRCAQCCKEEYGDNTVAVSCSEISRICELTGLKREEIAVPYPSLDKDSQGNIHTFGWMLRKNRDCIFLEDGLCRIYECRPHICRTYPFYLLDGKLMISECAGIGSTMCIEESKRIAIMLKERYVAEIRDSIAVLEHFRGFRPTGRDICVHDGEGEHWISSPSQVVKDV